MNSFECINLIEQGIITPTQSNTSNVKFPCTGFCYFAIIQKYDILEKYNSKDANYYNLIKSLILKAAERKKQNREIHEEGEFIDQNTIRNDFPDIFRQTKYKELIIATDFDFFVFENELLEILVMMQELDYLIVNRSNESLLMFKLNEFEFLVVDSHQSAHGILNVNNVILYVTRGNQTKGVIQIGIPNNDIILENDDNDAYEDFLNIIEI